MTATATKWTPTKASKAGLISVGVLAVLIVLMALSTYTTASLDGLAADEEQTIARVYAGAPAIIQAFFYLHIAGGTVALAIGPFQFSQRLRNRFTRSHRAAGRVYLTAVWLGALAGLVVAPYNSAGAIGVAGFGSLAILWFITGIAAYRAARERRLDSHRAWMIRNFALTFAGVTLRLWVTALLTIYADATGADTVTAFERAYVLVPFLSWVPNLLVAEWLVRRRGLPAFHLVRRPAS